VRAAPVASPLPCRFSEEKGPRERFLHLRELSQGSGGKASLVRGRNCSFGGR